MRELGFDFRKGKETPTSTLSRVTSYHQDFCGFCQRRCLLIGHDRFLLHLFQFTTHELLYHSTPNSTQIANASKNCFSTKTTYLTQNKRLGDRLPWQPGVWLTHSNSMTVKLVLNETRIERNPVFSGKPSQYLGSFNSNCQYEKEPPCNGKEIWALEFPL
jgi:hypothetical protein